MLEAILAAERQASADYTQRALEADAFGDKGLAVQLEDMVRDESGHSEENGADVTRLATLSRLTAPVFRFQ